MLRKAFLGDLHPTQSKADAAKVIGLYLYAGVMAYRTYKTARELIADLKEDRKVAGVHMDDLTYRAFQDTPVHVTTWKDPTGFPDPDVQHLLDTDPFLNNILPDPADYWYGDVIRGYGPGKPNPHKEGTREWSIWNHNQDLTSF